MLVVSEDDGDWGLFRGACVEGERELVSPTREDPDPPVVLAIKAEEPEGCAVVGDESLASDEALDLVGESVAETGGTISDGSRTMYLF